MLDYKEALDKDAEQSASAMYNAYMTNSDGHRQRSEIVHKARVLALVYGRDFHEVHDTLEVLVHVAWMEYTKT